MNIGLVVSAIVVIVIVIVALKVIQGILKLAFLVLIALVLVSILSSYYVVKDAAMLSTGVHNGENVFLLAENGNIVSGVKIEGLNLTKASGMSEKEVKGADSFYKSKEYSKISGNDSRVFIFTRDAFQEEVGFELGDVISYLGKDERYIKVLEEFEAEDIGDDRSAMFSLLTVSSIKKDPFFLIKGYREGSIDAYPISFIFRILNFPAGGKKE